MDNMISQIAILVLSLAVLASSVKDGDYMEFYVSGKDLPSNGGDCGFYGDCTPTGRFGYKWMSGKLMIGGHLRFTVNIDSELIKDNSPVWINDVRNITVINTSVSWSRQRMFVYEEGRNSDGRLVTGDIAGMYYMDDYDLEENVAKSCDTKLPFELTVKGWSDARKTVTLLFHCTKFVPNDSFFN